MTNNAQRTPVSLLQELCATHNIDPNYQLMSVEGAVHCPTFTYRVQVNEIVATATGNSKKKAKHAAAKAVLEQLLSEEGGYKEGFVSDGVAVNAETLIEVISDVVDTPAIVESSSKNPVAQLQELCMKKKWSPPYYETEKATGPPHEKVFSIMCMVDNTITSGEAKTKRLAKREAAENMINKLKVLKIISEDDLETVKGSKKVEEVLNFSLDDGSDKNSTNNYYSHEKMATASKVNSICEGSARNENTEDDVKRSSNNDNLEGSFDELVIDSETCPSKKNCEPTSNNP